MTRECETQGSATRKTKAGQAAKKKGHSAADAQGWLA